ncbi:CHASE3 domain-containing protein [Pedobacter sp. L105]|uniref:CHASE3 domain-containing protein n=1 Tax=Pedobacter sp. L105 TaxID=1641871 RepID=UPI00131E46F2|nr:CHASE3 domain-containing protein [Pedobacter sp. L105]
MVNTFKRNIRLGLGISLLALILSSTASYVSIRKLLESNEWLNHTSVVIQGLDDILSRMKDVETSQRGYLLTGDQVFLEPYTGSREDVTTDVDHIQLLTADNKWQQKDIPYLNSLINQKYAIVDRTISDKKNGISVTKTSLLEGKGIMDHIRKQIHLMKYREHQLMVARTSRVNRFATFTPLLILLASLVAVVVTFVFYRRMKANLADNQFLMEELERKEKSTQKNIAMISNLAEQLAKGNYDVRIKDNDLKPPRDNPF